jgi:hypothetical protein
MLDGIVIAPNIPLLIYIGYQQLIIGKYLRFTTNTMAESSFPTHGEGIY